MLTSKPKIGGGAEIFRLGCPPLRPVLVFHVGRALWNGLRPFTRESIRLKVSSDGHLGSCVAPHPEGFAAHLPSFAKKQSLLRGLLSSG